MSIKYIYILTIWMSVIMSCHTGVENTPSDEGVSNEIIDKNITVIDSFERTIIFKKLEQLLKQSVPSAQLVDSAHFLIIPIDAACNSCRDKAIEATLKHKDAMKQSQFVILSSNGMKTIQTYFQEQKFTMPGEGQHIFYDGENLAFTSDLIFTRPTIFNCYKGEAYEKIVSVPLTIKNDLEKFFVQ